MKNRLREELEAMLELRTGDSFTADNVHTLVNGIFAADEGGGFVFVEYDNNAFPYPQEIGKTAPSISGLGPADENMIDTIFIMPNKSTNPDATLMIVVDEKEPSTDPKTYQYVYVGNINDLPSDVLTEGSIVNDLSTGGTDKPLSAEQGRTLNSHVNYVTCESGAADQVKLIPDDGFELSTHLRLLVMMTNTNTNSTPKFNINNTGVKDVWYNGAVASDTNTWAAGEVLDVYYDGSKYVATPYLNVDDEPTAGSDNLVKSGGVYETINQAKRNEYTVLEGLMLSDSVYNSLLLNNAVDITPQSLTTGIVRPNGTVETNSDFGYADITIESGYLYNISMWTGGVPTWCGLTLYDANNNVLYNHIQGISGHFIFPKTAVTLRVCTYATRISNLSVTKQEVLSTANRFTTDETNILNAEIKIEKLKSNLWYECIDLSNLNTTLLTDGTFVGTYNTTNGYYDANGVFQQNSSYRSIEYIVKKNTAYFIYCNKYGSVPSMVAYDENNNVLFSVMTGILGKMVVFSNNVYKIALSTYSSWGITIFEKSKVNLDIEIRKLLGFHTGNNVFNEDKAVSSALLINDQYAFSNDIGYSAFKLGEVLNLYGETKLCVQPPTYQGCQISAVDRYGNLIINKQSIYSSDPVDITGAYRILVFGRTDGGTMMVNFGETALPYEPYYEYYDIKTTHSYEADRVSHIDFPDIRLDNRKSMSVSADSLGISSTLKIDGYPKYVKRNCNVAFEAKFTNFSSIKLYLDGMGRRIKVDGTKIYSQNSAGAPYNSTTHGLTISDYLRVIIKYSLTKITIILGTKGGVFKQDWSQSAEEIYGRPTLETDESTSLTDIVLSGTSDDFTKNVWVVGDSMVSVYDSRWPYYPLANWNYDNWLLQGLAGGSSATLWEDLQKSLMLGCPKVLVWLLGANDTNSDYQSALNIVIDYCNNHNIDLILSKFPDFYGMSLTEKKSSAIKNTYMLSKNKRYIDLRKAVTEEEGVTYQGVTIGRWYGDDLSLETPPEGSYIGNDRVHPTNLGAEAEAMQVLIDVPELMQL